eukprot:1024878-Alexandrium_andersonii.AAC.1
MGANIRSTEDLVCRIDAQFLALEAKTAALPTGPSGRGSAYADAPAPGGVPIPTFAGREGSWQNSWW